MIDSPCKVGQFINSPSEAGVHKTPSWDDYIADSILGEGAYGKVFKVFKKKD